MCPARGTRCHSTHLPTHLCPHNYGRTRARGTAKWGVAPRRPYISVKSARRQRAVGPRPRGTGPANGQSLGVRGSGSRGQTVGNLSLQPAPHRQRRGVAPPAGTEPRQTGSPAVTVQRRCGALVAQCTVGPALRARVVVYLRMKRCRSTKWVSEKDAPQERCGSLGWPSPSAGLRSSLGRKGL